jgi:hypothetical protein
MPPVTASKSDKRYRHGLTIGAKLPNGAGYVARTTGHFRVALESAVVVAKGEITLIDAASIQSAVRWERHALLCQRWLIKEAATLSAGERLAFSREIARASSERDKCLDRLGIDRNEQSIFDALYATPPVADVPPAAAPADASTASVGVQPSESITDGKGGTDAPSIASVGVQDGDCQTQEENHAQDDRRTDCRS